MATDSQTSEMTFVFPLELRREIEVAASALGKSLNEFAFDLFSEGARRILMGNRVTNLSARDSEFFMTTLDDPTLKPSETLIEAAKDYKRWAKIND